MKVKNEIEYTISNHYVTALMYGDLSGLQSGEVEAVVKMIEEIGTGSIEIVEGSEDFSSCEIAGLISDTIKILVTHFE